MADIQGDALSTKEGRQGQRAKAESEFLPETTCAPDLFSRFDALPAIDPARDWGPVRYFLGWGPGGPGDLRQGGWAKNIFDSLTFDANDLRWVRKIKEIAASIFLAIAWIGALLTEIWVTRPGPPGGCRKKGVKTVRADIQAKELAGRLTARSAEYQTKIDYAAMQYFCPTETVNAQGAVTAYLAWEIDAQGLHDYSAMNNVCPQAADIMVQSGQARPREQDWHLLHQRGILPDHEYRMEMRRLGWIADGYVAQFDQARDWWPGNTDVIAWMRHGVTSNDVVKEWDLDRYFDESLSDRPQKWLKGADTSNEMARYLWRSTYVPIQVSMAYDLYRRSFVGFSSGAAAFTDADLTAAIRYSDIPPKYHDAVRAAVWTPISARMLRTAYDEFLIDDASVLQRLVVEGMEPGDAQLLLSEWAKLRPAYHRHKIGALSAAGAVHAFAATTIGTGELLGELRALGLTPGEQKEALQEAHAERLRTHRADVVKYLKQRYLKGEVNESQVQSVLLSTGLEPGDVADLLRLWRTEFEVHPRQVSAAELVGWYKQGLIREPELLAALAQLRYSAADSARIVGAAELAKMAGQLTTAEKALTGAKKNLTADEKLWAAELKQAEQLAGKVSQRTRTQAGKTLAWVQKYVTGPPTPVAKKGAPTNGTAKLLAATPGESAADIDAAIQEQLEPGQEGPGASGESPAPGAGL